MFNKVVSNFKRNIIIGIALILAPILFNLIFYYSAPESNIKSLLIRIGYIYGIYILILVYKLLEKRTDILKKLFKFIFKYRYIIGIAIFLVMVCFKLSISSIGVWSKIIPSEENKNTTLIGVSRGIRSDEWLVQSSFALAQAMNKSEYYPLLNKNIRPDEGQNMLMVYASPVADLTIIGKPQNVGYLLFGRDYGFSWYWSMKLVLLVVLSIEIASILSKKDPFLSIVGGLWIAFSPGIMWWLSSVGDIYLHGFAIIALFYYYVRNTDIKIWKKVLTCVAMISSISGFVFCFYPPMQVPMGYLILAFIIPQFIISRKQLNKNDYILISLTVVISLMLVGYYYYNSKDAINLMLNTVYPGKRNLVGGDLNIYSGINYFTNIFTPVTSQGINLISNQCESASFIYPLIALVIVIISNVKELFNKVKNTRNYLVVFLISIFVILNLWCFVGFGSLLSKITLFYLCQPSRVYLILGLCGVMLSILLMSNDYIKLRNISKSKALIISLIIVLISHVLINNSNYTVYLTSIKQYILLPIIFFMAYFFILGNKKAFGYLIFGITLISGVIINPLERGTDAIYSTKTSKEVQSIVNENSSETWIGRNNINAQYLILNGAKTLNGINYYPNFEWLRKLDKKMEFDEVYNRYAHISIKLGNETLFELKSPDSYEVTMTYENLKQLGVKYMLTSVSDAFSDVELKNFNMKLIFSDTYEGQNIYMIN